MAFEKIYPCKRNGTTPACAAMELPQWNCHNGIATMELPQWNCRNGIAVMELAHRPEELAFFLP